MFVNKKEIAAVDWLHERGWHVERSAPYLLALRPNAAFFIYMGPRGAAGSRHAQLREMGFRVLVPKSDNIAKELNSF